MGLVRAGVAGLAAWKWGGGIIGTILVFLIVYWLLGVIFDEHVRALQAHAAHSMRRVRPRTLMFDWLQAHGEVFYWLTGASAAMFLASLIVMPVVLVRLPADFFQKRAHNRYNKSKSLTLAVARNVLGWVCIVAGLAMLVLPGQGLLMVLVGVMLADFPGKFRVERWIVSQKRIQQAATWLRAKFGKPPLRV